MEPSSQHDLAVRAIKAKAEELQALFQRSCVVLEHADGFEMNQAKSKVTEAVVFAVKAIHRAAQAQVDG